MFDFKAWLKTGLTEGYKQGNFSMPHVTTMTANYIIAGMLTQDDAAEIAAVCLAWDEELIEQEKWQEEIDSGFTNSDDQPQSEEAVEAV